MRRKFVVRDNPFPNDQNPNTTLVNLSQTMGAYEVTTVKVIKEEESLKIPEQFEQLSPTEILCAYCSNWLVLSLDAELHFFDLSIGCVEYNSENSKGRIERGNEAATVPTEKHFFIEEDSVRVIALKFLPSWDILVILLSNGTMVFGTTTQRFTQKTQIIPALEDCSMDIVIIDEKTYSACILDRTNHALHLISIPRFDSSIHADGEYENHFSLVKLMHTINIENSFKGAHFVTNMLDSFIFFPKKKGELVACTSKFPEDFSELGELFTLQEQLQVVRAMDCYVVALISCGKLMFYDHNLTLVRTVTLFAPDEIELDEIEAVLDFEFLDIDRHIHLTNDLKILIKVKTKTGIQFKIRRFNKDEDEFSTECSRHTILVPLSTPGDDNSIIYVDAFPKKSPDSIFLRLVSESQPLIRLNKLLELRRFDEALEFAKSYNLPPDIVYTSVVRNCQEEIQNADEMGLDYEAMFTEMMRNLDLLSDNTNAGDLCVAAFRFLNRYDHIKTILDFSKNLTITDQYTLAEIEHFRYELASYRMVYGSENFLYSQKSKWPEFLSSETHKEFFDQFCAEGKITEARLIFSRYVDISKNLISHEEIRKLISSFQKTIRADPTLCPAISEFIEADLIPIFLYSGHAVHEISMDLCQFFISISLSLEEIEPKLFPQNALDFSQTFNRSIQKLKKECKTPDQYAALLLILKQLDTESNAGTDQASIAELNTLIKNLTRLNKIHHTYQCPMNYSEYLAQDVHSICYRILDRLRSAPSIKAHIEQFLFPYIEEHRLDKNAVLHAYIKELASASRSGTATQNSSTWDLLSLQITEQITDINMRCRAIIEIASGTLPPWNQQLSNAVKNAFAQGEKIDPELIAKLQEQCSYADLGQIFIVHNIPLNVRSTIVGTNKIQPFLRFLFKNSEKEMATKLQDAFKIVTICESLHSTTLLSNVDCYYNYAIVLVQQFTNEEEITPLLELFQLIKSKGETEALAIKLVSYFKSSLKANTIAKLNPQRLIWLSCLLCVVERFMPINSESKKLIRHTRNIRQLQLKHAIFIGFETFRNQKRCLELLVDYIETPNAKSIADIVHFGNMLCLPLKESCKALFGIQIRNGLPDAVLRTLSYFLSHESSPTESHLEDSYSACEAVCWKLTETMKSTIKNDRNVEFIKPIVKLFKDVLTKLMNWSVRLASIEFVESFFKLGRFLTLFSIVLEQYSVDDEPLNSAKSNSNEVVKLNDSGQSDRMTPNKRFQTMDPRLSLTLPQNEGTMFDPVAVIKSISTVASSVVGPPISEQSDEFNEQMREAWDQLFGLLSNSHVLLEIQARQLANSLTCFNFDMKITTNVLYGMNFQIVELCKKIFAFPIADLYLAAHLLCSLPTDAMKLALNDLRRWAISKMNVRNTLNLIRVSLFVLMKNTQEMPTLKQVATWYEQTQWQKRLFKQGVNLGATQLKRDTVFDLTTEFAKVLLPSAFIKEYCEEAKANTSEVLLKYGIELCKFSSYLTNDPERFKICIETAKAALREINAEEKAIFLLYQTIREICPYNYEAIELILNKLQEFQLAGVLNKDNPNFVHINDCYMLIKYLKLQKRVASITANEIRWYKQFVNPSYFDISTLTRTAQIDAMEEETFGGAINESTVMPHGAHSQRHDSLLNETNLPKSSKSRLPFHMFLLEDKESIEKYQNQFIFTEITIYNVQHWILLVESTKVILQHSRTNFLVGAINTHVRQNVKYKRELGADDIEKIRDLTYNSHNRLSILKGLASRFQRISLSKTKISLLELCYDVIKQWVNNFEQLQIAEKERASYEQNRDTLGQLLAMLNTEFLLQNNGLLDAETATLTQKPEDLINCLLCSAKVDWTDSSYVESYFTIIDQLSEIHGVELEEIFTGLIDTWILISNEQGQVVQIASVDHDSSIDFMGPSGGVQLQAMGATEDSELSIPVLYDDPQTTRIVMLLNKIRDPFEKVMDFYRKFNMNVAMLPGGYMTKIRIVSCIMRFLDGDQMHQLFDRNLTQFCCDLVTLLNQRLYATCRVDVPSKEMQNAEKKLEFVRSILSPHSIYRQTTEIAHLLVCLIVDNGIDDLNLLGKTAQRLLQLRMPKALQELLMYIRGIRDKKNIKNITNLATYYGRTFESLFSKLDPTTDHTELIDCIHFLISCPVEADSQFMRSESMLYAARLPCAAALVAIASNAVADISTYQQQADAVGETGNASGGTASSQTNANQCDIRLNRARW